MWSARNCGSIRMAAAIFSSRAGELHGAHVPRLQLTLVSFFSVTRQNNPRGFIHFFPSAACITFVYLTLGLKLEILLSQHFFNCKKETEMAF